LKYGYLWIPMDTYCDACGVKKIDGKHPNQECEARQWAQHQGRMLREIIIALNKIEMRT
jgi:hypothetical protein